MIKYIALFSVSFLLMNSCGSDDKKPKTEAKTPQQNNDSIAIKLDTLKGVYYGDFGGSEIRIVLTYVSPNHGVGYNILKGLQRNISGKLTENKQDVILELHEPGDHKYDGIFYLTISKKDFSCTGTWISNNKKIKEKNFTLNKMQLSQSLYENENFTANDVNRENFTSLFYHVEDSIGRLDFEHDGLCSYKYYEIIDTLERKEQVHVIEGIWDIKAHKVVITWEENDYFPSEKTYLDIFIDTINYEYNLRLGKRIFYAHIV